MQPGKAKSLNAASSVSALIDAVVRGERDEAKTLSAIIDAALRGQLDEVLAHKLGPEAVALAMLTMSKHIAEQDADLARRETGASRNSARGAPADRSARNASPEVLFALQRQAATM